jgi:hypothetical protein
VRNAAQRQARTGLSIGGQGRTLCERCSSASGEGALVETIQCSYKARRAIRSPASSHRSDPVPELDPVPGAAAAGARRVLKNRLGSRPSI